MLFFSFKCFMLIIVWILRVMQVISRVAIRQEIDRPVANSRPERDVAEVSTISSWTEVLPRNGYRGLFG